MERHKVIENPGLEEYWKQRAIHINGLKAGVD